MAVVATLNTFADGTRMDSVTRGVVNIDPVETPFTSNRPVTKMENTVQESYYDVLYNVTADHTVYEGADTGSWWNQAPTTLYFIAETIRTAYKVTKNEYDIRTRHGENPLSREREKAGRMMKLIYEERAINSTQASGASGTARRMKGIISLLASYTTSTASLAFLESNLNNQFIASWNLGAEIDELFLPIQLKRKFAAFTGAATAVNADVKDKRIVNAKNLYESDGAKLVKVFASRILTNTYSSASASSAVLSSYFGVQGNLIKSGILGGVELREDEPDSMYDTYRGKMQGDWTIMLTNPKGGFVVNNER